MDDIFARDVHCLLGLPFDAIDTTCAVAEIRRAAEYGRKCVVSTPNVNWIIASLKCEEFRDSVVRSQLSIADGMPIVWIAKLLGIPLPGRASGSDIFQRLRASGGQISVYFFGGPDGVAELSCKRLNESGFSLRCVGAESPGFGSLETMCAEEVIGRINASGAQFVVVALGARKGQAWIMRNRDRLKAPVISHLGAVMNFIAGTVKRAPSWAQRCGLEWLWRIKEEPSLWRRYLSDGVSLFQLLVTRVIPYAWFLYWHRLRPEDVSAAAIEVTEGPRETVIRLRGTWIRENLAPLRACFSRVCANGSDLRIDLERVSYVDTSFLGLLMLLHAAQAEKGRHLSCDPASSPARAVFRYGCCEYLVTH